jgi:CheY-specific phosphatase CheX
MSSNYLEHFATSMIENLQEMAGMEAQAGSPAKQDTAFASQGFAVIIGITGKRPGRIILDTSQQAAQKLSDAINGEVCEEDFVLDTLAELTNIVSGNGITKVNNENQGMGLMLTPPSLFIGEELTIVSPKLNAEVITVSTPAGEVFLSVGFEGGK